MNGETLIETGAIGMVIAILCGATPFLAITLGGGGLFVQDVNSGNLT